MIAHLEWAFEIMQPQKLGLDNFYGANIFILIAPQISVFGLTQKWTYMSLSSQKKKKICMWVCHCHHIWIGQTVPWISCFVTKQLEIRIRRIRRKNLLVCAWLKNIGFNLSCSLSQRIKSKWCKDYLIKKRGAIQVYR